MRPLRRIFVLVSLTVALAVHARECTAGSWTGDAWGGASMSTQAADGSYSSILGMALYNQWNPSQNGHVDAESPLDSTITTIRTLTFNVAPGATIPSDSFLSITIFLQFVNKLSTNSNGFPVFQLVQVGTGFGVPASSVLFVPPAFDGNITETNTATVAVAAHANGVPAYEQQTNTSTNAPALAQQEAVATANGYGLAGSLPIITWGVSTNDLVYLNNSQTPLIDDTTTFSRGTDGIITTSPNLSLTGLGPGGVIVPGQPFTATGVLANQIDLGGMSGTFTLTFVDTMSGFLATNIVPEPSTFTMAATAALMGLAYVWRKHRRAIA